MAVKTVDVPGIGLVKLYKRRGTRSVRLSITARGDIRVTLPTWAPYAAGTAFVAGQAEWIAARRGRQSPLLQDGQAIGKLHTLRFAVDTTLARPVARKRSNYIDTRYPGFLTPADEAVQHVAENAVIRALRREAEAVLPNRLRRLADSYGFTFRSVSVKRLSGRWGSCDSEHNIICNLFLMQLPWELIDYVLLHELTHTVIMRHGPDFWKAMAAVLPEVNERRRAIKTFQPVAGFRQPAER